MAKVIRLRGMLSLFIHKTFSLNHFKVIENGKSFEMRSIGKNNNRAKLIVDRSNGWNWRSTGL